MPYLYLDKKLTSSPLTPLPGSLLFKKLSRQKSTQPSVHPSARRTTPPKSDHQTPQSHFAISILSTGSFIHFLYYIKNNHNLTSTFPSFTMFTTLSFTKECLRPANSALILFYYLSLFTEHLPTHYTLHYWHTERQWYYTYSYWQKHGLGPNVHLIVFFWIQTTFVWPFTVDILKILTANKPSQTPKHYLANAKMVFNYYH